MIEEKTDEEDEGQAGPDAPAGWYPDPKGDLRYWGGSEWLDIPPPDSENAPSASNQKPGNTKKIVLIVVVVVAALVLLLGGVVAWKVVSDSQAAKEAEIERIEEERKAEEEREQEERTQEVLDDLERRGRGQAVEKIEVSVKEMAEEHVVEGYIDGPILSVRCTPVGGGSTDDLDERSTVFDCFVANEKRDDGTAYGHHYNATMNWDTGDFTYGLGAP